MTEDLKQFQLGLILKGYDIIQVKDQVLSNIKNQFYCIISKSNKIVARKGSTPEEALISALNKIRNEKENTNI